MGTNGAAITTFDPLVDVVGTLADNNFTANAAILAPRTARVIGKLKDTTGQPLEMPPYVENLPQYVTNQISITQTQGSSSVASDIFVGDWRELLIGVRTTFSIQVLHERYADTGSIGLLAWFRGDVLVTRPKGFCVVQGVL
jgi:HK97 family phage major capsid protein